MKQQLRIQGMHCASCAMLIDDELEELDGVKASSTSYARQKTDVDFDDSRLGVGQLVEKIADLGYDAHPA